MAKLNALILPICLVFLSPFLLSQYKLSVDVQMVEVYASVSDKKGQSVQNLQKEDFEILEDGVPQTIESFEPQSSGLNVAILVDTTKSMATQLPLVKTAIADLVAKLGPDDSVGLFSFSTTLKTLHPFTKNRTEIIPALQDVHSEGATALYDALAQLGRDLSKTGGKKVILLFTDGADNQSVIGLDNAAATIRRVAVPIYTVAQGELLLDLAGLNRLKNIAKETNGISFEAHKAADFNNIIFKINEDLQHLYFLGYYSTNNDTKPDWRHITVKLLRHSDLKVRAKEGYSR